MVTLEERLDRLEAEVEVLTRKIERIQGLLSDRDEQDSPKAAR